MHPSIWLLVLYVCEHRISAIRTIDAANARRFADGTVSDEEVERIEVAAGADPREAKTRRIMKQSAELVGNAVNSRAWPPPR